MKGMRMQLIIRELRGEKIDIIQYSEDPVTFATHALRPAKVSRVIILDPLEKHMEVIVDDSQLSLAIGKKGQNVRLAAKLLGWKIDIKSEEEKRQEVESAMAALVAPGAPVSVLIEFGLPEAIAEALVGADIGTIEKLGAMTPEQLEEIQGIGANAVEKIQEAVNAYYSQFEEPATAAPEEATEPGPPAPAEGQDTATETAMPAAAVEITQESAKASGETGELSSDSATMEDAGSPTQSQIEGAGPEEHHEH